MSVEYATVTWGQLGKPKQPGLVSVSGYKAKFLVEARDIETFKSLNYEGAVRCVNSKSADDPVGMFRLLATDHPSSYADEN